MKRLVLHVERLVLRGVPYPDRHAIANALQAELSRLLARPEAAFVADRCRRATRLRPAQWARRSRGTRRRRNSAARWRAQSEAGSVEGRDEPGPRHRPARRRHRRKRAPAAQVRLRRRVPRRGVRRRCAGPARRAGSAALAGSTPRSGDAGVLRISPHSGHDARPRRSRRGRGGTAGRARGRRGFAPSRSALATGVTTSHGCGFTPMRRPRHRRGRSTRSPTPSATTSCSAQDSSVRRPGGTPAARPRADAYPPAAR